VKLPLLPTLLIASTLAGCGTSQSPITPKAPHGGMIFDLPENRGSVEVVRRPADDKPGRVRLSLYYLDAEMKPMPSPPAAATLKSRGRKAGSIEFRPPSGGDPAKVGQLESPDLPDEGDFEGELTAAVDGKPATLSISVR
jgi:hypothetical protein